MSSALKNFERMVETTRMTLMLPECRETLTSTIDTVVERTQDFTDSAYTSHEHRENILLLCDRVKLELNSLLRVGNSMVIEFLKLILLIFYIFNFFKNLYSKIMKVDRRHRTLS